MDDQRILVIWDSDLNGEWLKLEGHLVEDDGTIVHLGHITCDFIP